MLTPSPLATAALCPLLPPQPGSAGRCPGVLSAKTYVIERGRGSNLRVSLRGRHSSFCGKDDQLLGSDAGPISQFVFYSAAISDGREQTIVDEPRRHPPDWGRSSAAILREYDVHRYGKAPILSWASDNYEQHFAVGGWRRKRSGSKVAPRSGRPIMLRSY